MAWLNFSAIIITIFLYFLAVRVNSNTLKTVLLTWTENHNIKELSQEDIPEKCLKIGICSNITVYDTQFVNKLLGRINKKKFNVDQIMVTDILNLETEDLCSFKEEIIWPQAAKDERGKWEYIVNTDQVLYQAYRIERCIESGSFCSQAAIFNGIDNACYQENSFRKMVYINIKKKELATKYFQVPNCCSCKITEY